MNRRLALRTPEATSTNRYSSLRFLKIRCCAKVSSFVDGLPRSLADPFRDPLSGVLRLKLDRHGEMSEGSAHGARPVDEVEDQNDPFVVHAEVTLQVLDQLCPTEVDVAKGPTPLGVFRDDPAGRDPRPEHIRLQACADQELSHLHHRASTPCWVS